MSECPEPGIYYGVPFADYLAWDAVSSSRLKLASRSLAHYQAGWQGDETRALRFGSLVHAGKLEPMELAKRYAVMPKFELDEGNRTKPSKKFPNGEPSQSKSSTYYKTKKSEFEKANAGRIIVGESEYDEMLGVVKSLSENTKAMQAIGGRGDVEVSLVWVHAETGLTCKARVDKLKLEQGTFGDLKTTRDALWFAKHIVDHGYHRQAAFYQHGLHVLTGEKLEPWLVAVDSAAPYGCRAAPVCNELLRDGWSEVLKDMRRVAQAMQTDCFPGYENPDEWMPPSGYRSVTEPIKLTISGKTVEV